MEKIQIVESHFVDLTEIAKCHRAAFPDSLSTKLGVSYCSKMLEWYLSSENKFLFHLKDKTTIAGYCGGFIREGELHGSSTGMTQFASREGIKALLLRPWLFMHPKFVNNYRFFLRNFLLLFTKKLVSARANEKVTSESLKERTAGLVVIGVAPKFQGHGYGSLLLKEFEKKAKKMNCTKMNLTVESANDTAIRAYLRSGWEKGNEEDLHLSMFKII